MGNQSICWALVTLSVSCLVLKTRFCVLRILCVLCGKSLANREFSPLKVKSKQKMENVQISDPETPTNKKKKSIEPGIIYLSRIPTLMNVSIIRRTFERLGETSRIYLQPDGEHFSNGSKIWKLQILRIATRWTLSQTVHAVLKHPRESFKQALPQCY